MTLRQNMKLLLPGAVLLGLLVALIAFSIASAHPSGPYRASLKCGAHTASITGNTFNNGTTPVPSTPVPSGVSCTSGNTQTVDVTIPGDFNQWTVTYTCDAGASTNLVIPPTVSLGKWYTLTCPSPGGSHGPAAGDPPDDARVKMTSNVGGILEDPDVEALPSEAADSGDGLSAGVIAGIAGVAAAAVATAGGGFALWRRRIR
jgi:hypothetical protein